MRTLGLGARLWLGCPPVVEVPAHSWGLCCGRGGSTRNLGMSPWVGSAPSSLVSFRVPVVPPHTPGGPQQRVRGFAIKLRWIPSEIGTFKFSNSYVSGAGRTSGLPLGT